MTPHAAYSLRRRLLGWLLISTAVLGVLALVDTWREAVRTANTVSDRVLAGSALAIAERVTVDQDGGLEVDIPYSALEMLSSAAQDRVFYRVDGPPGTFLTGYDQLPILDGPSDSPVFADGSFGGEPIRIASLHRAASTGIDSVPFTVIVAETTAARRALTGTILLRSALRLAGMIGGAALIVWVAVTLSLRPLYRLGEAIALRSPDDLRPIEQAAPNEVRGLVDTVNSFMLRLDTALRAMRSFTGNASHQLRTPLAVVRTQLALAVRAGDLPAARAAAQAGDAALAEAERILAQLLLLARVDAAGGAPLPDAPLDLVALARDLTAEAVPAAAEAGIDLGFAGEGRTLVRAEPVLLGELLRNLLDNALTYAGRGAEVTVRVFATPEGGAVLAVEDDGPGIAPARREALRGRFVRGAEDGDHPAGLGLGLAIVEEIATLFGGRLSLEDAAPPDGVKDRAGHRGLVVRVAFPPAA